MVSLVSAPKLSRDAVAAALNVHPLTVDRWARSGVRGHRLPKYRAGGRVFFLATDVERFVRATSGEVEPVEPFIDADVDADAAEVELAKLGVRVSR